MDKGKLKGHAALWAANIIWGLNAPIGKSVLVSAANPSGISPFAMSVYRMVGAALLFWAASLFLPRERFRAATSCCCSSPRCSASS